MHTHNQRAFVNHFVIYTLVMIGVSGSMGMGAVWLRHQISAVANETQRMELRLAQIERRLAEINTQITAEQSITLLAKRNQEWRLGLVPPREQQVVRVATNVENRLSARRNAELYAKTSDEQSGALRFRLQAVDR